ncbi:sulfate permease [bacterium]|nr:sulfate permease [candidate division CSSED10-310 bacterium]
MVQSVFPIIDQLKNYTPTCVRNDLAAGLTVAVILVPQGMAYAMLAGLPPVIGLYASTFPLIIYALLGTSRQLAVGPVAMVSLLVFTGVSPLAAPGTPQYVSIVLLLCLLAGILQILLGVLHAGFLVNYVSRAVISGFTSAAAIIIGINQLPLILGISIPTSHYPLISMIHILRHSTEIHPMTCLLGISGIALLIILKQGTPRLPGPLILLILSTLAVSAFDLHAHGIRIIANVPAGLPKFSIPLFDAPAILSLLPMVLTIVFIGYMESFAVAQSIATRERRSIDPDRELIALGAADIAAGLFSGYPVTGGLSRTAVNDAAGARTGLAGLITAGFMLFIVAFLTPVFYHVPVAALAAIILVAVIHLFAFRDLLRLLTIQLTDGLIFVTTFILTLGFGVETGIAAGIILSLILFIRRSARPHMAELGYCRERDAFLNIQRFPMAERYHQVLIIRIDASMFFANAGFVRTQTRKLIESRPDIRQVIFDFEGVNDMDAVAVTMLEDLIDEYDIRHVDFAFARLKGPVRDVLTRAGWHERYPGAIRFRSVRQVLTELDIDSRIGTTI